MAAASRILSIGMGPVQQRVRARNTLRDRGRAGVEIVWKRKIHPI